MGTDKPSRWRGMLAPIGKPTGDGRMFASGSLSSRDLPLPLRFQRQDGGGHGGAVVVGRILKIDFRDDQAYAVGDWLDEKITPEVAEAKEWTRQRIIGPSVDLDDAVMELVPAEHATDDPAGDCDCDLATKDGDASPPPMMKLVTKGRISGATLVQIPAFAECAALELSDDTDWDDDETLLASGFAPGDPVNIAGEDDDPDDVGYFVTFSEDGEWLTVVRDTGDVEQIHASRVDVATGATAQAWADALTAAAVPVTPPAAWFDNPKLDEPTALTITDDGRVFGHLAKWGTCHVGLPGCTTAPRSKTNYAFFHTGELITDDGRSLEVGKITLGTGHAHSDAGFRAAADHYDNSGTCVATVRAGEDAHGIWVAGALVAGCDDTRVAELRRSPLSGDWRRIGSHLELVAALAVNVGGFPVPRARVASGQPMSLVAAGTVDEYHGSHNQADHAGKFTPRGKILPSEGIGVPKPLKARKPPASSEGHGAFWKRDRNGMAIEETPEDVFRRMMKRKKKFDDMMYVLEGAAGEVEEIQRDQFAADLLLLDPEMV